MSQVDPRTWEIHLVGRTREGKTWESRCWPGILGDRIDDKDFIYDLVRGMYDEYMEHPDSDESPLFSDEDE